MNPIEYIAARALDAWDPPESNDPLYPLWQEYADLEEEDHKAMQNSLPLQRFALLAREYCAGPGQEAAALGLGLAVACALHPGTEAHLIPEGQPLCFARVWQAACGCSVWETPDTARETLAQLRLFLLSEEPDSFLAPLQADERLLGYLGGGDEIDPLLKEVAAYAQTGPGEDLLIRTALADTLTRDLADARQTGDLLHLSGAEGIGKFFALSHAAARNGVELLAVDCRMLAANPLPTIWKMVDSIRREALFYGACICLRHADCFVQRAQPEQAEPEAWEKRFYHLCAAPLLEKGAAVCICTDGPASFLPWAGRPVRQLEFPDCTRGEQITLWQGFSGQAGVKLDAVQCGSKYKLTPRQIRIAVAQLASTAPNPTQAQIARVCGQVLPPPDQGGIRRIRTSYTLDDLKLPAVQKQKLLNIADHVLWRHRVYDEWNMESRFAYGRNVSALFVGPPGTGKTMAVHVLSHMLDLPLYRIDLSQVVDKYIGETEKRLEKIFDTAEKSNVILFFDEADSIFGKRSEVNDAKDKYANTEVSYILQRIEQYDGIVILATNYKRNIDEAFMRRMRYLVEFQLPTRELREEIWRGCFPPEVPAEDLDFAYLARQFELAGGSIKNVALNAVFLAAGTGGPVTMRHILESLRDENLKMGKPMLAQDFAEYAPLMQ